MYKIINKGTLIGAELCMGIKIDSSCVILRYINWGSVMYKIISKGTLIGAELCMGIKIDSSCVILRYINWG